MGSEERVKECECVCARHLLMRSFLPLRQRASCEQPSLTCEESVLPSGRTCHVLVIFEGRNSNSTMFRSSLKGGILTLRSAPALCQKVFPPASQHLPQASLTTSHNTGSCFGAQAPPACVPATMAAGSDAVLVPNDATAPGGVDESDSDGSSTTSAPPAMSEVEGSSSASEDEPAVSNKRG